MQRLEISTMQNLEISAVLLGPEMSKMSKWAELSEFSVGAKDMKDKF